MSNTFQSIKSSLSLVRDYLVPSSTFNMYQPPCAKCLSNFRSARKARVLCSGCCVAMEQLGCLAHVGIDTQYINRNPISYIITVRISMEVLDRLSRTKRVRGGYIYIYIILVYSPLWRTIMVEKYTCVVTSLCGPP